MNQRLALLGSCTSALRLPSIKVGAELPCHAGIAPTRLSIGLQTPAKERTCVRKLFGPPLKPPKMLPETMRPSASEVTRGAASPRSMPGQEISDHKSTIGGAQSNEV